MGLPELSVLSSCQPGGAGVRAHPRRRGPSCSPAPHLLLASHRGGRLGRCSSPLLLQQCSRSPRSPRRFLSPGPRPFLCVCLTGLPSPCCPISALTRVGWPPAALTCSCSPAASQCSSLNLPESCSCWRGSSQPRAASVTWVFFPCSSLSGFSATRRMCSEGASCSGV